MTNRCCAALLFCALGLAACAQSVATNSLPASERPEIAAKSGSAASMIFVASRGLSGTELLAFPAAANGNVVPLHVKAFRTVISLFGANASGDFWALGVRFSGGRRYFAASRFSSVLKNMKNVTVSGLAAAAVDPKDNFYANTFDGVTEYAVGGARRVALRSLNFFGVADALVAVNSTDHVFVSAQAGVEEFGPRVSGNAPPIRTISTGARPTEVQVGPAGNLYMTFATGSSGNGNGIWIYAPGSSTPTQILSGTTIVAFALDAAGSIYAEVPLTASSFAIEVFPDGATSPVATISGPSTQLVTPQGITVTP